MACVALFALAVTAPMAACGNDDTADLPTGDDDGSVPDATGSQDGGAPEDASADRTARGDAGEDATTGSDTGADATASDASDGAADAADAGGDSGEVDAGADSAADAGSDVAAPCSGTPTSCGDPGACVDCTQSSSGAVCLGTVCGCNSSTDCPTQTACNPLTNACSADCSLGETCNGGCCDGSNCVAGTADDNCATGSTYCESCVNDDGDRCVATTNGRVCGCQAAADCFSNEACDVATATCVTDCNTNQPCNGGCCSAATNGTCLDGQDDGDCGSNGRLCASCTNSAEGHTCEPLNNGGGYCGCDDETDCPRGQACDGQFGTCSARCDANHPCNGGCCTSDTVGGMCVGGTTAGDCGDTGGLCAVCTMSTDGHACIGGASCGCESQLDCPVPSVCDVLSHTCN